MPNFPCPQCERVFSRRSSLRNHVKTHDSVVDRVLREIAEAAEEDVNILEQMETSDNDEPENTNDYDTNDYDTYDNENDDTNDNENDDDTNDNEEEEQLELSAEKVEEQLELSDEEVEEVEEVRK